MRSIITPKNWTVS